MRQGEMCIRDRAKARLFEAARSGEVRVLMGSTQKLGEGTNVQTRLVALHHLDCPWPVSYTHLDVYKRQAKGSLAAAGMAVGWAFVAWMTTAAAVALTALTVALMAA